MTQDELIEQIESTAAHCRSMGESVTINRSLPWIEVHRGIDEGWFPDVYFFQGEEASNLLNECPDYVSEEDYILWISQGW